MAFGVNNSFEWVFFSFVSIEGKSLFMLIKYFEAIHQTRPLKVCKEMCIIIMCFFQSRDILFLPPNVLLFSHALQGIKTY